MFKVNNKDIRTASFIEGQAMVEKLGKLTRYVKSFPQKWHCPRT